MMSRSTVSSLAVGESGPTNWMRPSPLASSKVRRPVVSHFVNHSGTSAYGVSETLLIRFVRAKTATAGAVV